MEYVWLDGYETPNLRSKVKVIEHNRHIRPLKLEDAPEWNFDGSSTKQAIGEKSECVLKPVRLYQTDHNNTVYVLCGVHDSDGNYHESNNRIKLSVAGLSCQNEVPGDNEFGFWWGFEQEYFMMAGLRPTGFPPGGYPKPQGEYYCGIGYENIKHRHLAEAHMHTCLEYGIEITGINAEVALGQWEYQVFARDTVRACDDLWMSRYLLHKMAESHQIRIDMSPKPIKGDWNGSGCHTNFSNHLMRGEENEAYFKRLLSNLEERHQLHITAYGKQNEQRLTGDHETQHIGKFSWGVGDRGASIRVPNSVASSGWIGYVEDRRPAANCDPYVVARLVLEAAP